MKVFNFESKSKIEKKIRNLEHNLEYTKRVYSGNTKKINRLRCQVYYYKKKLEKYNTK